jgi:hypothetical protein
LTAKHAKNAKKDLMISGIPELPLLTSIGKFRFRYVSETEGFAFLCALCELCGEAFGFIKALWHQGR